MTKKPIWKINEELPEDERDMPSFVINENELTVSGKALPRYAPTAWGRFEENFDKFLLDKYEIVINFKLEYMDSSSSRFLAMMLDKVERKFIKGRAKVNWYFAEADFDSENYGEMYKNSFPNIDFSLVEE